jgi:hypothetical protein
MAETAYILPLGFYFNQVNGYFFGTKQIEATIVASFIWKMLWYSVSPDNGYFTAFYSQAHPDFVKI